MLKGSGPWPEGNKMTRVECEFPKSTKEKLKRKFR